MSERVIFDGGPLDGKVLELEGKAPTVYRVPMPSSPLPYAVAEGAAVPLTIVCGSYLLSRATRSYYLDALYPTYVWQGLDRA